MTTGTIADDARIDHRTLEAQAMEPAPTQHMGPTATAMEQRTAKLCRKRLDFEIQIAGKLAAAKAACELKR